MKKYLTDNTNNFIADRISNIHLALCFYSSVGWLSGYHSRILVFLLPTMMFNWLMDDDNCWMTRLEYYFRIFYNTACIHNGGRSSINQYIFEYMGKYSAFKI